MAVSQSENDFIDTEQALRCRRWLGRDWVLGRDAHVAMTLEAVAGKSARRVVRDLGYWVGRILKRVLPSTM